LRPPPTLQRSAAASWPVGTRGGRACSQLALNTGDAALAVSLLGRRRKLRDLPGSATTRSVTTVRRARSESDRWHAAASLAAQRRAPVAFSETDSPLRASNRTAQPRIGGVELQPRQRTHPATERPNAGYRPACVPQFSVFTSCGRSTDRFPSSAGSLR
jgi:hypothetical protein